VKVVSNASPLITLARVGHLNSLHKLYPTVHIPGEVYNEVVNAGAGMPGASAVAAADWIRVSAIQDTDALAHAITKTRLGGGEVAAVLLAKELTADLILMDEWKGRKLAIEEGLAVVGCVAILEQLYRRGQISDLRQVYLELLFQNIRVDTRTLQASLKQFGLDSL
jgi:predicted nucleic acid-binding protein